jgi:threonine/homoserine/homoserine lactone efflux protein
MDINLTGFLPVLLPVVLSPGASFTLAINSALNSGRRGLFKTLAGTALGIYTHALLVAFGLSSILATSATSVSLLKIAGSLYLLWLGIQLMRSARKATALGPDPRLASVTLLDAWLANVLNPKAFIFYLAVVSQFAGQANAIGDYLVLASVHIAVMGVWLIVISNLVIFSASKVNPRVLKKIINTLGGAMLIIYALKGIFSLIAD